MVCEDERVEAVSQDIYVSVVYYMIYSRTSELQYPVMMTISHNRVDQRHPCKGDQRSHVELKALQVPF